MNTPEPEVDGVTFAVFNATSTAGLAAEVQQMLEDEGYTPGAEAANAPTTGVAKTTVYFRGGADAAQNESNATNMAEEFFDGAEVKLLGAEFESAVPEDTQLVVVIGADYPGAEPSPRSGQLLRYDAAVRAVHIHRRQPLQRLTQAPPVRTAW